MKFIKLFDNANAACGDINTPAIVQVRGKRKPVYVSKKLGPLAVIVLDDTYASEDSPGIKPIKGGDTPIIPDVPNDQDNTEIKNILSELNGNDDGIETSITDIDELLNQING